ncbi:MAG: hypothetical protein JNJ54_21035 [Myxococcaceae bacterium]|nr:hypothetical protein [Myxococcaceae bacterium]
MATRIRQQILQATADRRITQREVDTLLQTARANGVVSAAEKRELKTLLATQASLFTAGAKKSLAAFLEPGAPVAPVTPAPAGAAPVQVELPASTNPFYPNQASWYGVQTGRKNANGEPVYGFFSRGMAISPQHLVKHAGRDYPIDKAMFRLGADSVRPNNAVAAVEAGVARSAVPDWAKNGSVSLLHAPDNKPFLDAMMNQLMPQVLQHIKTDATWYPELAGVTAADITNLKVDYVANYGQFENGAGNGRRIAISYDVKTRRGVKRMASDISDPFYVDPLAGGRYGFIGPSGGFVGRQPVDHVRFV